MAHARIEMALSICGQGLQQLEGAVSEIAEVESRLVAGLVTLIVSEYEELIEGAFVKRAEKCGDAAVVNYVRAMIASKFRSPDIGKITETLGRFGCNYREDFSRLVLNTETHAAWDNIMRARHAVVHKQGSLNLTFRELEQSYPKTKSIISHLVTVLEIQPVEN